MLRIFTFGVSNSFFGGLMFLRLGVKDFNVSELVFLRLGVKDSYV